MRVCNKIIRLLLSNQLCTWMLHLYLNSPEAKHHVVSLRAAVWVLLTGAWAGWQAPWGACRRLLRLQKLFNMCQRASDNVTGVVVPKGFKVKSDQNHCHIGFSFLAWFLLRLKCLRWCFSWINGWFSINPVLCWSASSYRHVQTLGSKNMSANFDPVGPKTSFYQDESKFKLRLQRVPPLWLAPASPDSDKVSAMSQHPRVPVRTGKRVWWRWRRWWWW